MPASGGRFVREQLHDQHAVDAFDCGEPELNAWLRDTARSADERGYSRVYVWHEHDDRVVAYFSLSSYAIGRGELPSRLARGEYRAIPSLLLGKLALDVTLRGQGLGDRLMADAVVEALKASQYAAARYLVVDALNERVAALYERFGFVRAKAADTPTGTIRLLARLADLRAALPSAATAQWRPGR